jgi:hexosaminidase
MIAMRFFKVFVLILFMGAVSACSQGSIADDTRYLSQAAVQVIPAPRSVKLTDGVFVIGSEVRVLHSGGESAHVAHFFSDLIERSPGIKTRRERRTQGGAGAIRFELTPAASSAKDAYTLSITAAEVRVQASTSSGLFYGAVTLWQLLSAHGEDALPAMTIEDSPRFAWRGLMIDSARHFQSIDELKQVVDVMAMHKLNVLHWHLTDDQAWRLEIKKYPKLTSVGAWRVPAGAGPAADLDPVTGKPRFYGGYYTQEQARELIAYAADRHITIVPEIEMPGHASAAIVAYPQLGVTGVDGGVPADWGVYENLFNVEESTFAFLEDVLTETMAIFPSEYIHVGGDEAVKHQWENSVRVQQRMQALGVEDAHALQSYFIQRMEKFLGRHGRRLIGWDEILEGGLAPNATVMSWRGIEGAVAAATAGHDAVLSAWPTLYFDNRPLDVGAPPGRGRVISVENVYRFDPMPQVLDESQRNHILGVQANVWTEHIRTFDRLQYMILPRLAALSEIAWSQPQRIDWESFSARLPTQLSRYDQLGLHYADAKAVQAPTGKRRASHQLDTCSDKLPLALEDDAPVRGERAVFFVDIMQPCWIYRNAQLSAGSLLQATVGQVPFNFQIGEAVKEIKFRAPSTAAGELEVRIDGCEGERIASHPLAAALDNSGVTSLPPIDLGDHSGTHDLCFTFTQIGVNPTWVIDSVELIDP